jgi:hypothetical protein
MVEVVCMADVADAAKTVAGMVCIKGAVAERLIGHEPPAVEDQHL